MDRRTKIVCTLGPASSQPEVIRRLIEAGMNIARLNFSHGAHDAHARQFHNIRAIAAGMGVNVAIMMDLQGPKIRTGPLAGGESVELIRGKPIILTTRQTPGDASCVSTSYQHLPQDVRPGDRILIADGVLELTVCEVQGPDVRCEILRGGTLGQHKGINLPGVRIAEPSLTEKDKTDLAFGMELGVDYAALSFVRSPDDLHGIRAFIRAAGADTRVVAKIERPEALGCFDRIVPLCDAIMVARGDLGVEMPFEEVPVAQKNMIRTCNELGVPVITATQMLESMTEHPRPTRAEATDVANAIFDGSDAVMLSAETAAGKYPVEACDVMARIAAKADEEMAHRHPDASAGWRQRPLDTGSVPGDELRHAHAIGLAIRQMTETLGIRQVACFTSSGYTAAALARFRPNVHIVALTASEAVQRRCALLWGVSAVQTPEVSSVETMIQSVEQILRGRGLAQPGESIIIVAGYPLAVAGRTNFLKLHTIGA